MANREAPECVGRYQVPAVLPALTLPAPGFYILISRLLDTRRKSESLAYSQPFTLQTQLATRSSADRSSESFKIRSIRRRSSQVSRQVSRRQAPEAWSVLGSSPQVP